MAILDRVRGLLERGVSRMTGAEEYDSIFDHERVDFDASELARIKDSFRVYGGLYPPVVYKNAYGKDVDRPLRFINMLNEVSRHLGSILFNEHCGISFAEGFNSAFIEQVLQNNDFIKNFSEYIQVMLATGGLAVKPYYDAGEGQIKFSWTLADVFIPLHSNTNNISEAVIASHTRQIIRGDAIFYTLLEFHEWLNDGLYRISNELYKSDTDGKLGRRVELSDLYEGLEEVTLYKFFSRPNFAYLKPFGFNNIDPASPLGLGICDNAKSTLDMINSAYDRFVWEIEQADRKIIVSDHFLRMQVDDQGRRRQVLDENTNVYQAMPGGIDDLQYKDITPDIRADAYIKGINKFIETLEMQTGLSAGTFTFDGEGIRTATEVVSENSMTYRTRNSHITNVENFIKELIISTCELARETFDGRGNPIYAGEIPTKDDIAVAFDDGVFGDKNSELEFWLKSTMGELAPKQIAMQKLHDITEDEALEWIAKIQQERSYFDLLTRQLDAESQLTGGND